MARVWPSKACNWRKKSVKACCGAAFSPAANWSAVSPKVASASLNAAPCACAACNLPNMALMAVAATSGGLPKAIKASPKAAASSAANPNCLAVPPMRVITLIMSASLAAVLLPNTLMASARAPTLSMGI